MHRAYFKWYSPHLLRDMELLVFGHAGARVLFFPTRGARFYDYEDWRIIDAIGDKISNGLLQVICVDSVDHESFYNLNIPPADRILRHLQYEKYIMHEVLPFSVNHNTEVKLVAAGCSLGAYHAVNLALKHPGLFTKVVGMSGRYDLTMQRGNYINLFDDYFSDDVYYNMPNRFIANLTDATILNLIKRMDIILVTGREDAFFDDTRHLSVLLWSKQIANSLYIWEGEAHRARYWRKMVQFYL